MRLRPLVVLAVFVCCALFVAHPLAAQSRTRTKKPAPKAAPKSTRATVAPADVSCPTELGTGIATHRDFCDVTVGRDPQTGIIIKLPPHKGPLTLTFDLHNRVTYSEQLVREKRAFTRHTATIGVLTLDGQLITRAVVETEFRNSSDLLDRVSGGAGPGGMKAVAPIGDEPIRVEIPEGIDAVSVLGEKLLAINVDGPETIVTPGRPIAIISNVEVEYRPAPPAKKKATTKARKKG